MNRRHTVVLAAIFVATAAVAGVGIYSPTWFGQKASAQKRQPVVNARPVARVQARVDNGDRVAIGGHTLQLLKQSKDLGRLSGATAMDHMVMTLQASPEQDHALKSLVDQQLDQNNANFHQWLTPEQFGAHFGVADEDIAKVSEWLTQQGFRVEQIAPGKRFIQFSGTVGKVESAFQTEMHRYNVNGEKHVANSKDITVPSALRPVISGVSTLQDFFKKPVIRNKGTAQVPASQLSQVPNSQLGKIWEGAPSKSIFSSPNYTNGSTHFVGAGDFATIYNTTPLIQAGFDGTGVSIGVIGRTDIDLGDVQTYREMFGVKNNDPQFVVVGEDPGMVGGDDGESYLDVEVSGGAAPGATVKFITARATLTVDGVDLAAMYAVQNNLTDVISESYGQCEANFSPAGAAFYNNLWAQAAAQGQSVFVSSGDSGPAGCDSPSNTFSNFGYAVSMLASSPYNVAVGGTIFNDTIGAPNFTIIPGYWGTTATTAPPFSSALGYIPETPWNESKNSGAPAGAAQLWSGSGGISAYFQTPSWQRGFGVPLTDPAYAGTGAFSTPAVPFVPGPHRYLPDVSMAAAAQHDGTLYCAEGICQLSSTNSLVNAGIVGGTSVAAPTMAGVQALIDSKNGGRQGLPTYVYYALADAQHTAGFNCSAEAGAALNAQCAFRDVDTGNTLICADSACTVTKKIGWTAAAGYDLATGLGSPNATALANLWNTVTFNSTTTTLGLSQTTGITHGQPVTATGTVTGSGPTPTGQVAFIPSSGSLTNPIQNDGSLPVAVATLDGGGNYSMSLANLPAGTYFLTARYGGDGFYASSISAPIQVTVTQEPSTLTISPNAFNGTTCVETPQTTFTYGSYVWTDITATGNSAQGIPTGTVSVTDNSNPLTTTTLNPAGFAHTLSGSIPTTACIFGYTFQDTPPLTAGTHAIGASYGGDSNFGAMTATPVTVTITPATLPTPTLATGSTNIAPTDPVQLTFTQPGLSGAGPGTLNPTGTVTFTDTTTSTTLGTATLSPAATSSTAPFGGRAILTTNVITAAGAHSITASWPGDANYNGITSSPVTVTVQAGTATSVAVTSNTQPSVLGGRPTWTATMTPTTVTSGTVTFYDNGVSLGTNTVGAGHTTTFRPAATVNLPVGVHNITAIYAGNATFNSSVSPIFAQTFTKASTTISLTVLENGQFGQKFILSGILGTLVSATPPSGTIAFFDGATQLGTGSITTVAAASGGFGLWQGQILPQMTIGTHTITAQLIDPNYTSSVSNTQTVTVVKANTTTAITSDNPDPSMKGQTVPVTYTVTPALGGSPTGNVTVSDGVDSCIGTVASGGCNIVLTTGGARTLTATYAGDSNFNGSTSTGAAHQVNTCAPVNPVVTNHNDAGAGSLRQAISGACFGDTITFGTSETGATITLTSGELSIAKNLTINGLGSNVTVSGNNASRVFTVNGLYTVTISGLTVQNGNAVSAIAGNTTGGGIYESGGTLILDSVTVRNNNATGSNGGGVLFNGGSNHILKNSTLYGNTSASCAGFQNSNGSSLTVTNVTVSGNNATGGGGGGFCTFDSTATVINATVSNNQTIGSGGGVNLAAATAAGALNLENTIVAGNTAGSNADISLNGSATLQTSGNNLIGSNDSVTGIFPAGSPNGNNDIVGTSATLVDPRLSPLGFYGGPTFTQPLDVSSPAVNAGSSVGAPTNDQRGAARVGNVDIGAFELNDNPQNGGAYVATLPGGIVNDSYSFTIAANDGGYTYTVLSGALPPGITLHTGGTLDLVEAANPVILFGRATTPGNFNFAIQATKGGNTNVTNFALNILGPTAAHVGVSGRVLTSDGSGLRGATVVMQDASGNIHTAITSAFGYYHFDEVEQGSYVMAVQARKFTYGTRVVNVNDELTDMDFVPQQ